MLNEPLTAQRKQCIDFWLVSVFEKNKIRDSRDNRRNMECDEAFPNLWRTNRYRTSPSVRATWKMYNATIERFLSSLFVIENQCVFFFSWISNANNASSQCSWYPGIVTVGRSADAPNSANIYICSLQNKNDLIVWKIPSTETGRVDCKKHAKRCHSSISILRAMFFIAKLESSEWSWHGTRSGSTRRHVFLISNFLNAVSVSYTCEDLSIN